MNKFYYLHIDWDNSGLKELNAKNWEDAIKEVADIYKSDRSEQPNNVRLYEVVKSENVSMEKYYKEYDEELKRQNEERKQENELRKLNELAEKYGKKVI